MLFRSALRPLLNDFWALVSTRVEKKHRAGRLKQWLNFLRRRYPEAEAIYAELRTVNDAAFIDDWLRRTSCVEYADAVLRRRHADLAFEHSLEVG